MVSCVLPCGNNHEVLWGSAVTSTRILFSTGKSSFIWDFRGSILVNVQKRSKKTSNYSRLGTSAWAIGKGCVRRGVITWYGDRFPLPVKWNTLHILCLEKERRRQNQCRKMWDSKLRRRTFLVACLLLFCWRPDFVGLIQSFLLPLMEVGSQISNHLFFFFRLFNNRWHDQLDSLALLDFLRSECLVQINYKLLSLTTNDSILLCRPRG